MVFAHYGEPGEKGVAYKPDDTSGAYACSRCHDWLDGRLLPKGWETQAGASKLSYWFRGMRRTWRLLIENGVLR